MISDNIAASPAPRSTSGATKDAVLEAVSIGQLARRRTGLVRRRLNQDCRRRGSALIGVCANFGTLRHTVARHQVVPGRKREEAVLDASIKGGKRARSAVAENRDFCKLASGEDSLVKSNGFTVQILTFTTLYPSASQPQHGFSSRRA